MARSIHRTRRDLEEARHSDYADAQEHAAQLEQVSEQLEKKRRIKDQVARERLYAGIPTPPTPPEAIPIHVVDEGDFIHYPASPEDIRAVMQRLPMGVLDGLRSISLYLGREDQEEYADPASDEEDRDPLVGRHGSELWPGVFSGRLLGRYRLDTTKIRLCAYVYDAAMPDREVRELYLRLQMLSTFMHEVAHHFDRVARVGRGRWLMDSEEKVERYAESLQHEWVQRCVVPYLEEAYPEQSQALNTWIEHHGGVSLPLGLLAGDPRAALRGIFSVPIAFESLMQDVAKGEGLPETRLGFACQLHYVEHYPEALAIIDRVLAEYPEDAEALTMQADIYWHQGQYDAAETVCRSVLARDETDVEAWEVLSRLCEARRDWPGVLTAATRAIDLCRAEEVNVSYVVLHERARARLELGDFEGLEEDLQELAGSYGRLGTRRATALRAVLKFRLGYYEEALRLSVQELAERFQYVWEDELMAVRFEAAHRLGRPGEAGEFSAQTVDVLRSQGHEEWMDRLAAEFGIPAGAQT